MTSRFFSLILFFCLIIVNYGQTKSHHNKLPWVNGVMPPSLANGYYKVISADATSVSEAQKVASSSLIYELATQQGVSISIQAINEMSSQITSEGYKEVDANKQITHIKRDDFEANFSKIDEYYEFNNGRYQLWSLFFIANDSKKLANIPTMAYKTNNGAWRSLIMPGWAQFYTGKTTKGIAFLAGTTTLIGAGFYFDTEYTSNIIKSKETTNLKIKKTYRDQANQYQTYSYIAFGAATGLYLYNVIDAFVSKSGKVTYDPQRMGFYPTTSMGNNGEFLAGVTFYF
ncbi:DUF5683 domain-containing protein [Capnocytophaga canimorsus]|uniref:DUF5683 domain-containing protein n=1 Tax=Capnocytophaga canimorsus TaxID=28188 RepID=UPI0037CE4924